MGEGLCPDFSSLALLNLGSLLKSLSNIPRVRFYASAFYQSSFYQSQESSTFSLFSSTFSQFSVYYLNPMNGCVLVSVSVYGGAKIRTISKYEFIEIIIYEFVFRQVQIQNCVWSSVNIQV